MMITDWSPNLKNRKNFTFRDEDGNDKVCLEMPLHAAYFLLGALSFRVRQHLLDHLITYKKGGFYTTANSRLMTNLMCFLLMVRDSERQNKQTVLNEFDDSPCVCSFSSFNREFVLRYNPRSFGRDELEINDIEWEDHSPEFRLLCVTAFIRELAKKKVECVPLIYDGHLTNN